MSVSHTPSVFHHPEIWLAANMLTVIQILLTLAIVSGICTANLRPPHKSHKMTFFAAGYNGTIVPFSLDPELVQISSGVQANASGTSPSWIAYSTQRDGSKDKLYSVTDFYSVDETAPGRIFSHTYNPKSGEIVQTGTSEQRKDGTSSGGDGPVSCLIGHGESKGLLFVANYNSGSAGVLGIKEDGTLESEPRTVIQFTRPKDQPKIGPVADRQDHSYAHQVSISPSGEWVYVVDLGADQIHHLHIKSGQVEFTGSTNVKVGSGPRHITFYKDDSGKTWGYLASELDNTVSAFTVNESTGELSQIGNAILASPPGVPLSGEGILPTNRTTAEIAVVPQGDFVYVSNRGDMKSDHISIFRRNQSTGRPEFQQWVESGGRMPRHFSLSSESGKDAQAKWLVVGHQTDQNIVVFSRDAETGKLEKVEEKKDVGQVAFVGFSPF